MDEKVIKALIDNFGAQVLSWVPGNKSRPYSGRFLLKTEPLPPADEIIPIISDIQHDRILDIVNGKLRHDPGCLEENHVFLNENAKVLKKSVGLLKEETFMIAIKPDKPLPVVTVLEPEISFRLYPDHPHLNFLGDDQDTLCYVNDPEYLGNHEYDRLRQAIGQAVIWLFRHQVWKATREITSPGVWIGLGSDPIDSSHYPDMINPDGVCRCGSKKAYFKCHMIEDIMKQKKCTEFQAKQLIPHYRNQLQKINTVRVERFNALKRTLLS